MFLFFHFLSLLLQPSIFSGAFPRHPLFHPNPRRFPVCISQSNFEFWQSYLLYLMYSLLVLRYLDFTNYINVKSVKEHSSKVEQLGGKVMMPKTPVPRMGYFAVCTDTENNTFALWEPDESAK